MKGKLFTKRVISFPMEFELSYDVLSELPWTFEQGTLQVDQKASIFYFSLTTCSHCKKGLQWMRDLGVAFRWLEIDQIELEKKNAVKKWIQKRYAMNSRMASPFVIFRFPERDFISNGFDPDYWKAKAR